ncbi:MAG: hypothetical protein K9W44_02735 [Candidatus Lokiarchaeota archaeon]|nr:hypothetical protein [Candidatus Harpocratesius repetitus]
MVRKRKPKYLVKTKKKAIEEEKNKKRTIEEKFYWVKVIVAVISALFGVLVFDLRGWWMFLYLVGFILIWPFIQSFLIFRLPYKKEQWDWKQILKTGIGAFFFIFMLVSTACFTLVTYSDYKDQVTNPADTYDIIIDNNTAYVADGENGLLIINIQNYNHRELLGKYYIRDIDARLIEKSATTLYLADHNYGIRILDVSNPSVIIDLGNIPTNCSITQMQFNNSKLIFGTENSGLYVYDCSNSSNPSNILHLESNKTVSSIEISTNLIIYSIPSEHALKFLNISNIDSSEIISTISLTNDTFNDIEIKNNFIFLSTSYNGLLIYNISDIVSPQLVNAVNFTLNPGQQLLLHDNILFYNTPDNGTFFIDIENPLDLTNKTNVVYNSLGNAYNLQVVGDYLYIADGVRGIDRVYIPDPGPSPVANDTASKRTVPFGWEGIMFAGLLIPVIAVITGKHQKKNSNQY